MKHPSGANNQIFITFGTDHLEITFLLLLRVCSQLPSLALGILLLLIRCREMRLPVRYQETDVLPLLVTHWLETVYRAVA
jgi:hypothetical protein